MDILDKIEESGNLEEETLERRKLKSKYELVVLEKKRKKRLVGKINLDGNGFKGMEILIFS